MPIDAGTALRNGLNDLASARGAILYAVFAVFSLASLPIHQTLTREMNELLIEMAPTQPDQFTTPATPLALDVGLSAVAVALVVIFLVAEAIRLVAIRAFASDAAAPIPTDEVTHDLVSTYVVLLVASVLVQALVYGGIVLFVIPGLVAALLTVFVRQAVVLDGEGIVGSIRRSVSVVVDETVPVLLILVALIVASIVVGTPTVALDPAGVPSAILGTLLGAVITVYGVAVVTDAYVQVDDAPTNQALGPDDLDGESVGDDLDEGSLGDDESSEGATTP